ncbi:hypothetical protein ABU162_25405 [Paenibacillus thiaminolyticus]
MEWKRARVSQETPSYDPLKFFVQAGIKDEVELCLKGNIIIMRTSDHPLR